MKLKLDLWKFLKLIEQTWLQKSRQTWFSEGDKNTKFFHRVATSRHRKNFLGALSINGVCIDDPILIKEEVCNHFSSFFKEKWKSRPKILGPFHSKLSSSEAANLEVEFSQAESLEALKECDGNKAPSPDEFNMSFIKKCWSIIKDDFCAFINEFHKNAKLPKGINSSFLTLIPKIPNFAVLRPGCKDSIVWAPSNSGEKSLYSIFESSLNLPSFPAIRRWKSVAPPRIKAFGWLTWWNRIATSDFLFSRNIIPTSYPCAFCELEAETPNHLLLLCPYSWKVWSDILNWWGLSWISPGSIPDLLTWWYSFKPNHLGRII